MGPCAGTSLSVHVGVAQRAAAPDKAGGHPGWRAPTRVAGAVLAQRDLPGIIGGRGSGVRGALGDQAREAVKVVPHALAGADPQVAAELGEGEAVAPGAAQEFELAAAFVPVHPRREHQFVPHVAFGDAPGQRSVPATQVGQHVTRFRSCL